MDHSTHMTHTTHLSSVAVMALWGFVLAAVVPGVVWCARRVRMSFAR